MAKHSSATAHSETPHVLELSRTNTIMNALKRRAQAVLNHPSLNAQSRAVLRYGLETNDPWLAELVRRADAGEGFVDAFHCSQAPRPIEINSERERRDVVSIVTPGEVDPAPKADDDLSGKDRIEALAEIICGAGDESAGALFVLMGMLEHSTQPNALANTVKHFAFTCCGELNLFGMVDAQIVVLERELLAHARHLS